MKNALVPNSKLNAVENTSRYVIISVLNWNSAKVTLKCMESLLALDTPDNVTIKIRVFDNGSSASVYPNSIENAKSMFANHPNDMWVVGTALFCRLAALRQVGMLDDRLFAYYEDDDICARLSHAGWTSKIAFGTKVLHARTKSSLDERPPYYFYLMARNSIRFWCAHTPKDFRRLLKLKLLDRNLLMANSLRNKGLSAKTQACLLGIFDGLTGRTGAPELSRRTPVVMKILMYFRWWNHRRHIQK
jgi:GT2 family glycosyltransferase